ncbi:hypothetical protein Tco_0271554 [Tanacetum coccineum]
MADKYEYEKRKKEKLEEVKARLDFGDARKKSNRAQESAYSESRTISPRRQRRSRSPRHNPSVFARLRRERSRSPRHEYKSILKNNSESEDNEDGHWKSKSRRKKFSVEDDDLSQPWVCAETDPFTSQIRHFNFPKTRMPSHVKTYNGSEDPEDHLKIFQAAAKKERWAMPTWCHMFNSTLTGNTRKKCNRDPICAPQHQTKDGETTEDFHTKGKRRLKSKKRKKVPQAWRHPEGNHRQNFKKGGGFRSQHKAEKKPDRFTLLTKTPKEILALEKGKFKTPPPMTTPVEKQNANKFCEFHREVGHNTDECNHLRKQIEDMLKAGKLSHIIRELKQNSGKEQPKKKGETSEKESLRQFFNDPCTENDAVRQKITQSFSPDLEISFPPLGNDEGGRPPNNRSRGWRAPSALHVY